MTAYDQSVTSRRSIAVQEDCLAHCGILLGSLQEYDHHVRDANTFCSRVIKVLDTHTSQCVQKELLERFQARQHPAIETFSPTAIQRSCDNNADGVESLKCIGSYQRSITANLQAKYTTHALPAEPGMQGHVMQMLEHAASGMGDLTATAGSLEWASKVHKTNLCWEDQMHQLAGTTEKQKSYKDCLDRAREIRDKYVANK